MTNYHVITRERYGHQYWLKPSGQRFAASDATTPMTANTSATYSGVNRSVAPKLRLSALH